MSVVAIKVTSDSIEIAADSIGVQGTTQEKDPGNKIFKIREGLILGSCGTSAMGLLMREHLTFHEPKENTLWGWLACVKAFIKNCKELGTDLDPDSNAFLVICDGRAWYSYGLHVKEVTTFHAIGAGADFALTALHLGQNATQAVNVACELCTQCERPITLFTLPK